jgi:hypothetical protein
MGMKMANYFCWSGRILALLFAGCAGLSIVRAGEVSAVTRKGDQMLVVQGDRTEPMTADVTLPHDVKVMTNGTFTVKDGKPRDFKDGDRLGVDGMMMSPSGRIEPVFDHITKKKADVVIVRDGQSQPLRQSFAFPDGSRVSPDATVRLPDGSVRRLLDGQLLTLSGVVIPAKDTISLQNGKVTLQKDGSLLSVPPGRSMMMNDGTKVFGNGTVIRPDGSQFKLTEGQIVTVEGVVNQN